MLRHCGTLIQSFRARGPFASFYPEVGENFYSAKPYYHFQEWKRKCAALELIQARYWLKSLKKHSAGFYHEGRHPTYGYGPFESELQRRGIEVHKYRLPTTTAVKRIHEMVLLRRQYLEGKSTEAMQRQRAEKRKTVPSEWYDETHGPLNPHYLRHVQRHYTGKDITDLPSDPKLHGST